MQKVGGVWWRRLAGRVPARSAAWCMTHRVRGVSTAAQQGAAQLVRVSGPATQPVTGISASPPSSLAVVGPRSELAYRARLRHVRFDSLLELRQLPYAPDPLQILVDAMAYAKELHRSDTEVRAAHAVNDKIQATHHMSSRAALRARLAHALARRDDVRLLMQEARARLHEAVQAADEMGDVASMTEVRREAEALDRFADFVLRDDALPVCEGAQHNSDNNNDNSSGAHGSTSAAVRDAWRLSDAVRAELLRGLLQLAREAGSDELAVSALDALLALSERHARLAARQRAAEHLYNNNTSNKKNGDDDDDDERVVSVDELPALVQEELQGQLQPLQAGDHLCAMQSCARGGHFDLAASLYRRLVQHAEAGAFHMAAADFTAALIALAQSCRTVADFHSLRDLVVRSEATSVVPVSVELYTALIDAVGRVRGALPARMSIALALYRRLRDGALRLNAHTYAALIGCCAAVREPTQAFAFYHEARASCRLDSFPPALYTSLLRAYSNAGYGADARKTLDVLVEAGAPLTRAAFHAVLRSAVSLREAHEVLAVMTARYRIAPTPHSYAYLVRAAGLEPAGVQTVLELYDLHEAACKSLAQLVPSSSPSALSHAHSEPTHAEEQRAARASVDQLLLQHYPRYVRALEHTLLRVRVDLDMDSRLRRYLTPLLRVVQQDMNRFTQLAPQVPTRLPERALTCVAVLAPDVLTRLDECVVPFLAHYSALVIPYSALATMRGEADTTEDNNTNNFYSSSSKSDEMDVLCDTSAPPLQKEECHARLVRFLHEHRDVIHLVSLEDELRWSCELTRYGAGVRDAFARCAALAMHLARDDVTGKQEAERKRKSDGLSSAPYAAQQALIVLVSTHFERCGRYVVQLRQHYRAEEHKAGLSEGLARALRRVYYHNPNTQPHWSPPMHSVAQLTGRQLSEPAAAEATDTTRRVHISERVRADCEALPSSSARALYASLVHTSDVAQGAEEAATVSNRSGSGGSTEAAEMDAAALMSVLAEDDVSE